jgi:hypothetical protein
VQRPESLIQDRLGPFRLDQPCLGEPEQDIAQGGGIQPAASRSQQESCGSMSAPPHGYGQANRMTASRDQVRNYAHDRMIKLLDHESVAPVTA